MMGWSDVKRYSDMVGLLMQFGWLETTKTAGPVLADDAVVEPLGAEQADKITLKLEALGPCYIKLGQFLSSRSDILPRIMMTSLSRLQDRVRPFDFAQARRIVESELGARLSRLFVDFEHQPFASASLSQVHRATMHDGRAVAVKIQRPHIQSRIYKDIQDLQKIAAIVDRTTRVGKRLRTRQIMAEFKKVVVRELDFRIEAAQTCSMKST